MTRKFVGCFLTRLLMAACLRSAMTATANVLDIYVIAVEGGEATLFVAPSGASMLVDAGWPDFDGRDAAGPPAKTMLEQ
jgi:competence protein ComEC